MRYLLSNRVSLVIIIITTLASSTLANYEIRNFTIDSGGGVCAGSTYTLNCTIGQPDTGIACSENFIITGGYLPGMRICTVNLEDLEIFIEQWLSEDSASTADFDNSGTVDLLDFAEFSYWWLYLCPADWPLK